MTPHSPTHGASETADGIIAIDSDDAEGLFGALSSGTAREILVALYEEPRTSSKVADVVDTSLQNVNHHLTQLQNADLVEVVGTTVSEQGREMNQYGPATDSLVLHAGERGGDDEEASDDREPGGSGGREGTSVDDCWDSGPDVADSGEWITSPTQAFLLGTLAGVAVVTFLRSLRGD